MRAQASWVSLAISCLLGCSRDLSYLNSGEFIEADQGGLTDAGGYFDVPKAAPRSPDAADARNPQDCATSDVCREVDNDHDAKAEIVIEAGPTCVRNGPEICNGIDDDCSGVIDEG